MSRKLLVLLALVCMRIFLGTMLFAAELNWKNISQEHLNLKSVLVNPYNPKEIYIGTKNSVLKTDDGGASWQAALSVKGPNTAVRDLSFDHQNKNALYAATGNGLYYSYDKGANWKRLFKGNNVLENECVAIAVSKGNIFLGTKSGLFISFDKGKHWRKASGINKEGYIFALFVDIKDDLLLFVISQQGVFKLSIENMKWEKMNIAIPSVKEEAMIDEVFAEGQESMAITPYSIIQDTHNPDLLYAATSKGVFKSEDGGSQWESLPSRGCLSFLNLDENGSLYATQEARVFQYKNREWLELSSGFMAGKVNGIAFDALHNIYCVTEKGLFVASFNQQEENILPDARGDHRKSIPSVYEVQREAVRYAEVEPEKIISWRKKAAYKAWLPRLAVGVNRDITDLWHWESGSTTKLGDDELLRGDDAIEWNVSLSWDLSDLVWNAEQTAIDVRSRLTVELRNDILDEVNRLYFERLKVEMELTQISLEDKNKRTAKLLKLEELTASLDAFTNGFFSDMKQ